MTTAPVTSSTIVRKGSSADEELREMQLRILKEDSEDTQKSVLNPFLSHHASEIGGNGGASAAANNNYWKDYKANHEILSKSRQRNKICKLYHYACFHAYVLTGSISQFSLAFIN